MMRKLKTLLLILCLCSCGFKGPPIPIFPTSATQADTEVKLRSLNHEQDKMEQSKVKKDKKLN